MVFGAMQNEMMGQAYNGAIHYWCLDKNTSDPTLRKIISNLDEHQPEDPQHHLHCIQCGHHITALESRISVLANHTHVFTNPHGLTYCIGCFREAPGITIEGTLTPYWSWFSGYSWQLALCTSCGTHLGWSFANSDDQFHGLIMNRLVERSQPH